MQVLDVGSNDPGKERVVFSLKEPKVIIYTLWVLLYITVLWFIIIPYFRSNQLLQWDSLGHFLGAWYQQNSLWPFPGGWNPIFFTGFPQGTFYPPLFHYLVAGISFLLTLPIAFQSVVSLAIFLTPVSFYCFGRSIKMSRLLSTAAMFGMSALIFIPVSYSSANNAIGGTLYSTFDIGLVVNALALPICFFYLSLLHSHIPRGRYIWPSIVLGLVVLTHSYTALAAAAYTVVYTTIDGLQGGRWKIILKHVGLSLLLTAWWWVPFIVYRTFSSTIEIDLVFGSASFLFLFVGLGVLVWLVFRNRLEQIKVPAAYFLFMTFGLLLLNTVAWPIHAYRLILFPMLIVPLLFAQLLSSSKLKIIYFTIAASCIIWGVLRINHYPGFNVHGPSTAQIVQLEKALKDRVLMLSGSAEQLSPHINQFSLPLRTGNAMSKGLFVESSSTARYLLALEKMMDTTAWVWGIPLPKSGPVPEITEQTLITKRLQQFAISTVLSAKVLQQPGLTDAGEVMRYALPEEQMSIPVDEKLYTIPLVNAGQYFYSTKSDLLLVDRRFESIRVVAFKPEKLEKTAILQSGEMTFFIQPLYRDVWIVDFMLNPEDEAMMGADLLTPLREYVQQVPPDIKSTMETLLSQLGQRLEETNVQQARQRYTKSQRITIQETGRTSVLNADINFVRQSRSYLFHQYTVPNSELIEPLRIAPEPIMNQWQLHVDQWFFSDFSEKVLIQANTSLPMFKEGKVSNVTVDNHQNIIRFNIEAQQVSPAYIKVSYFPRWRAFQDGAPVPLYRASPNAMVVYGQGAMELRYVTPVFERLTNTLSLLTVGALVIIWIRKKTRKNKTLPHPVV